MLYALYWDDEGVKLNLGEINESEYEGELVTVDLVNSKELLGYSESPTLEIEAEKMTIGNKSFDLSGSFTYLYPNFEGVLLPGDIYDYLNEYVSGFSDYPNIITLGCNRTDLSNMNISVTIKG